MRHPNRHRRHHSQRPLRFRPAAGRARAAPSGAPPSDSSPDESANVNSVRTTHHHVAQRRELGSCKAGGPFSVSLTSGSLAHPNEDVPPQSYLRQARRPSADVAMLTARDTAGRYKCCMSTRNLRLPFPHEVANIASRPVSLGWPPAPPHSRRKQLRIPLRIPTEVYRNKRPIRSSQPRSYKAGPAALNRGKRARREQQAYDNPLLCCLAQAISQRPSSSCCLCAYPA